MAFWWLVWQESPASHLLAVSTRDCVWERGDGRDKERGIWCFYASQETETHTPLVSDRLKAREKRLCLDRERASSITSSTARKSTFKQRVNGEFLKLGWDSCGSRSSYGTNRLFSHKVTMLLVYISRQQRYLASSCWLHANWTVVEGFILLCQQVVCFCSSWIKPKGQIGSFSCKSEMQRRQFPGTDNGWGGHVVGLCFFLVHASVNICGSACCLRVAVSQRGR